MQYSNIQLNAADGYGKNFRLRGTDQAPTQKAKTDTDVQAAKTENAEPGTARDQAAKTRSVEALVKMVDPVERFMQSVGVSIKFHVHEQTKELQAEVKSADGEKTIRKIPSDEVLRLVASMKEMAESEHTLDKAF